jgi:hypothetical protein
VIRRRLVAGSLYVAVGGAAIFGVELYVDPVRACYAYLVAWSFGVSVCIGALLMLMTDHASKGDWMVVTRRSTEAIVAALPLFLVLFVPIALVARRIYPWARPLDELPADLAADVARKHGYLNVPFFVVRSVFYLLVFAAIGGRLRAWSISNDAVPRADLVQRMRKLSGGALPVVALVVTWAAFDWTMSLEPRWTSTIYGLYFFAGSFLAAIAVITILSALVRPVLRTPFPFTGDHAQAAGRLLLAMTCFWAYMAFSQLLIYWIANIPEEISYYALRTTGSWNAVTYFLVFGHFVIPFFALLNRHWKRDPRYLGAVGGWMIFMHLVDVYWLIMPVHDPNGVASDFWLDAGAVIFVVGISAAWVLARWSRTRPLPRHVPGLAEGIRYEAAL